MTVQLRFWSLGWRHTLKLKNKNRSVQKQPPRGVPMKRCSENMQEIYRRTPMPKCNFFIEIAFWHSCSRVNLLHIFRAPFPRNTSGWLLLNWCFFVLLLSILKRNQILNSQRVWVWNQFRKHLFTPLTTWHHMNVQLKFPR